jgi:hypothetical protein
MMEYKEEVISLTLDDLIDYYFSDERIEYYQIDDVYVLDNEGKQIYNPLKYKILVELSEIEE